MAKNKKINLTSSIESVKQSYKKLPPKVSRAYGIITGVVIVLGLLYLFKGLFVVAIVGGSPITRLELVRELEKQGGSQVLDSLVTQKIIYLEASKKKVSVSEAEIDNDIAAIEEQLKAQGTDINTALSMQGQTMSDLKKSIKLKLVIEKILADKLSITDAEITEYFNTNKATLYKENKLEEVKEDIRSALMQQKLGTEYQTWIEDLKTKTNITKFVNF